MEMGAIAAQFSPKFVGMLHGVFLATAFTALLLSGTIPFVLSIRAFVNGLLCSEIAGPTRAVFLIMALMKLLLFFGNPGVSAVTNEGNVSEPAGHFMLLATQWIQHYGDPNERVTVSQKPLAPWCWHQCWHQCWLPCGGSLMICSCFLLIWPVGF